MSIYRVDRGAALLMVGVGFVVSAVGVVVAFLLAPRGGPLGVVGWVFAAIAVVALLVAARFGLRPPVVARLDDVGLRARGTRVEWIDVEGVDLSTAALRLTTTDGEKVVDLTTLGPRRAELAREVYDRLNAAHGYTRFA
ncbi:hypothetical protein ASD11_16165 [Aeromicrobium sp. Root495]|uniref:hypothetical protein n=1 Tax=Aeromicrobium sp. Root495 TaxID=1736550 RepID=UPI0006FAB267|nr:hypothetical protein [Aeromicrobium sp. Root495]KQY56012.1 hypothetical protein ASD11_16165 [Aeromicrobium sp. Root495]RYJ05442.1 MAG: hypothetical protein EON52_11545 [Actinomycetales bacterium]